MWILLLLWHWSATNVRWAGGGWTRQAHMWLLLELVNVFLLRKIYAHDVEPDYSNSSFILLCVSGNYHWYPTCMISWLNMVDLFCAIMHTRSCTVVLAPHMHSFFYLELIMCVSLYISGRRRPLIATRAVPHHWPKNTARLVASRPWCVVHLLRAARRGAARTSRQHKARHGPPCGKL